MRITTWNINSVRIRLDLVRRLVREARPDVLCLQETKVPDDLFPHRDFEAMGFAHRLVHGMKGYNGVAILSRVPFSGDGTRGWCEKQDCRHAHVKLPGGIELHNLYIPAGGDIPDPAVNDKFKHKLRFVDEVGAWFGAERTRRQKMIAVGDFNIAPLETDVWSHKQLLDVVSHTPIEVEKLGRMQASVEWVDAVRHFVPPEQRLYTWWSYRNRDWKVGDRGRRLDHVWVTPPMRGKLRAAEVLRDARDWESGSDHVPVTVEIEA
ncbi:MAG: exodeoxyribonuclease III [Alphaproteobacteria bacterium]|nr:exodeoxyribonuclease III [Alphaproteobacteria bacterium]